jgi:DNA-binding MarR family transcriptional regulator
MRKISLQDFFQLCSLINPTQLLILISLSESVYSEVWVSEVAIAKKLNISTKTVQRAIKKMEKLKFLSVKRFPGTGEVNRYSLNHDAIRKAIEKVVYGFDPGLSQLIEQVQSGTGNQKFRDFLDRHKLIDTAGTIDLSGLSAIGTTLAEISQAMNADSIQKEPEPEKPSDLPDSADLSAGEYSGSDDRKNLCPDVKKLFLRVHSGEITHPGAVRFFRQSDFKALWDDPDSAEAAKIAAQGLGELYTNGLDAVLTSIYLHWTRPEEGKFEPDL